MSIVAYYPSRLGQFTLGHSRLGVYTAKHEEVLLKIGKTVTWRVANHHVTRNTTTGVRRPSYSLTHSTVMHIVERGGRLPSFASGVAITQDAVGITLDNMQILDQSKDGDKIYEVYEPPEDRYDLNVDSASSRSFAFRVVALQRTDLFREG